jgi:hypothetical protein
MFFYKKESVLFCDIMKHLFFYKKESVLFCDIMQHLNEPHNEVSFCFISTHL